MTIKMLQQLLAASFEWVWHLFVACLAFGMMANAISSLYELADHSCIRAISVNTKIFFCRYLTKRGNQETQKHLIYLKKELS